MGPLRLRVSPVEGESLSGFMVRTAERARLGKASEVAAMTGLRLPGSAVSNDELGPLAKLTGVPVDLLVAMIYRPVGDGRVRFLGSEVDRDLIALRPRRACPKCLSRSGIHRMEWDLAPATACLRHRCRLATSCPACGRRYGWECPSLTACRCGMLIAAVSPVPDVVVEALAELYAIVGGASLPWLPEAFAGYKRSDLVKAILVIGMAATGWTGQRRVVSLVATGPDAVESVVVAGVDGLRRWPASVEEMLRDGRRPPGLWPGSSPVLLNLHKAVLASTCSDPSEHVHEHRTSQPTQ